MFPVHKRKEGRDVEVIPNTDAKSSVRKKLANLTDLSGRFRSNSAAWKRPSRSAARGHMGLWQLYWAPATRMLHRSRNADLALGHGSSRLATARQLSPDTATSSLGALLGLGESGGSTGLALVPPALERARWPGGTSRAAYPLRCLILLPGGKEVPACIRHSGQDDHLSVRAARFEVFGQYRASTVASQVKTIQRFDPTCR